MEITIALGGGGAKGNAHIGVLRRLEKEGFKIRAVAGTSFGGIVAAMYAAGRITSYNVCYTKLLRSRSYRPRRAPAMIPLTMM